MELPSARYVGHATVLLRAGGLRVITDPVLGRRCAGLTRVGHPVDVPSVDLVVISHLHADHLDLRSLRRLSAPMVIVPRGAGDFVRRHGVGGVVELGEGESVEVRDLKVSATGSVHDHRRWPVRGPVAPPVGYLFDDGQSRSYFAGDTDLFDAMGTLGPIDLALLPVWGWGPSLGPGHLDPGRAAEAVRRIAPRAAVPIHWGTLVPPGFARRMSRQLTAPPRDFAAAVDDLAAQTRVLITEPGDEMRR